MDLQTKALFSSYGHLDSLHFQGAHLLEPKNCVEHSWHLNYGGAYALQLVGENGCGLASGLAQFHQFSFTH